MYHSILVPLDGSPSGEQSLPYAATLAQRSGASLQLTYVHTPLVLGEGTMYLGMPEAQLWDEEKQYLARVADRLKKAGVEKVTAHVLEGTVAGTLQEHALDQGCDLVVMTTHGRGPVSRFWLGSVADQLVHRLPMPLLLIRTREEETPSAAPPQVRRVLIALDGTPAAEQILRPAGELAKLVGASLTLLRVIPSETPPGVSKETAPGVLRVDMQRAEAHVYLRRVADSLRDQGFAVGVRIIAHGHPATAILNESASDDYDLLALETHGRRGLPRLFLGSVADKVVRGATVPVLVHRCLPD